MYMYLRTQTPHEAQIIGMRPKAGLGMRPEVSLSMRPEDSLSMRPEAGLGVRTAYQTGKDELWE